MTRGLFDPVPAGAQEAMPGERCPRCAGRRVHRRRARGVWERSLRLLSPWRPFECHGCRWRGVRIPVASEGPLEAIDLGASQMTSRRVRRSRNERTARIRLAQRRRQFLIALLAAMATSGLYLSCQEEREPLVIVPL